MELLDLAPVVSLAQLLADRLELLAQQHLALALAQLLLHLRLDLLLRIEHVDLALDVHQEAPQPLLHRHGLEQRLAVGRLDVEITRHEVGEAPGVGHALEHLLHDLFGQTRLLAELRGTLASFAVQAHERGVFGVERRQLLRLPQLRFEVAPGVLVAHHRRAHVAVQRQLQTAQAALHLADTGDRPEPVQPGGGHEIHVLPLHHGEDATRRALQRRLDGVQRGRAAGSNGGGDAREEHHVPQRQHREGQFLTHQLARRIEELSASIRASWHHPCHGTTPPPTVAFHLLGAN